MSRAWPWHEKMQIRSPLPKDRAALKKLVVDPHNPFRDEEVACALELLEAVLVRPEGNTYEALAGFDENAQALCYACFGATPMTDATFDVYWMVTAAHLRGHGLGARLLADVEAQVSLRGARLIRIETSSLEGQGGAQRFYERQGYRMAGLIADFYRPGDDLVTLVKRLVR